MTETPTRRCAHCKQEFPATREHFYKKTVDPLGVGHVCKECTALYGRKRYAENKERILASRREYYWRDPEKSRAKVRQYTQDNHEEVNQRRRERYAANPEAKHESDRRYREKNRAKIRARQRRWEQKNPEKAKATKQRYYGRRKNAETNFSGEDWQRALDYFHGCCAVCGRPLNDLFGTHRAAADHWIPLAKGGSTTPGNIVPLCCGFGGCNNSKKDKLPRRWLTHRLGSKQKAQAKLAEIEAYFEWAVTNQ